MRTAPGQIDQASFGHSGKVPNPIAILAALEALRCQQEDLHKAIPSLVALMKMVPEGQAGDALMLAVSSLDSISGNMKRVLDLYD